MLVLLGEASQLSPSLLHDLINLKPSTKFYQIRCRGQASVKKDKIVICKFITREHLILRPPSLLFSCIPVRQIHNKYDRVGCHHSGIGWQMGGRCKCLGIQIYVLDFRMAWFKNEDGFGFHRQGGLIQNERRYVKTMGSLHFAF